MPYKAYSALKAIGKTIYRLLITHKNLLEWTTSEEAEKLGKTDFISYYKNMLINVIAGIISFIIYSQDKSIIALLLSILWIITPAIMWYISKESEEKQSIEKLTQNEKEYVLGEYSSKEKAYKAMEMLRERHTDNVFCREDIQYKAEIMLDEGLNIVREMMMKCEYFQFPKDDEVKV